MQWYVNVEFAQIALLMVRIYSCWEAGSLTTSRDVGCIRFRRCWKVHRTHGSTEIGWKGPDIHSTQLFQIRNIRCI